MRLFGSQNAKRSRPNLCQPVPENDFLWTALAWCRKIQVLEPRGLRYTGISNAFWRVTIAESAAASMPAVSRTSSVRVWRTPRVVGLSSRVNHDDRAQILCMRTSPVHDLASARRPQCINLLLHLNMEA